jgi:transposase
MRKESVMGNGIRFVGLDVHKDSITVAVADRHGGAARSWGTIANEPGRVSGLVQRLGERAELRVCYEAGPCGYELQRELSRLGVVCVVIAPSLIPHKPGDRVKTDRRDALKLASLFRAGELTPVWVPGREQEALRDLTRAREAAQADRVRARNRLGKLLLRWGLRRPHELRSWTVKHRQWLGQLRVESAVQQLVLESSLLTLDQVDARVQALETAIVQVATEGPQAPLVAALQSFRGIGVITAVTLVAELGHPERFDRARQLMSYLGMVPSEYSSGARRKRGALTKTGNGHARYVTVETAWHYRHRPYVSTTLKRRQQGQSEAVAALSWKAQERLHHKYWLMLQRNKSPQQAAVAVGRELLGFVWAMARLVTAESSAVA